MALILVPVALLVVLAAAELARAAVARANRIEVRRRRGVVWSIAGGKLGRVVVLAVGPLGAYLALAALAFVLARCHGIEGDTYVVVGVAPDGAAHGKLAVGDRLVALDGEPLRVGDRPLARRVHDRGGAPLAFGVERGADRLEVRIAPLRGPGGAPRIGLELQPERVYAVADALPAAAAYPVELAIAAVRAPWRDDGEQAGSAPGVRALAEPRWVELVRHALRFGTYGLLALLVLDAIRIAAALAGPRR